MRMPPLASSLRAVNQDLLDVTGAIHSVESCGTVDGPGIRTIFFLQGCKLACKYCHNPDSWDRNSGQQRSVRAMMQELWPYRRFHLSSQGGLTLSGGDPLAQPEFSQALLLTARQLGIHTALDTAGGIALDEARPVFDAADMVLLDYKHSDPTQHKKLTGIPADNPRASLQYLATIQKPVWIRHVIIPGWTDQDEHLHALGQQLAYFDNIKRIDILPFHTMGDHKWQAVGKVNPLADTPACNPKQLAHARSILANRGLPVMNA